MTDDIIAAADAGPLTASRATTELRASLLFWRTDPLGRWTWADARWTQLTGQAAPAALGLGWLDRIHPADRALTLQAWDTGLRTGRFVCEHRIRDVVDERSRWFRSEAEALRDEAERILEWTGASSEITNSHARSDREGEFATEMQRRVRNVLAVVRSIAVRTAETSDTIADLVAHLDGRLGALARTQLTLTRSPDTGLDLESLVREEVLAQAGPESALEVAGPDVYLFGKTAEVLSQAIHELTTNAVKYGALSTPGGTVTVGWSLAPPGMPERLHLHWREAGVRVMATAPRRRGFGAELVEQRLAYELRGKGELVFRPGGVACLIEVPLDLERDVGVVAPARFTGFEEDGGHGEA